MAVGENYSSQQLRLSVYIANGNFRLTDQLYGLAVGLSQLHKKVMARLVGSFLF